MLKGTFQARCPLHHPCKGTICLTISAGSSSSRCGKALLHAKNQRQQASLANDLTHRADQCSWTRHRIVSRAVSGAYVFSSDAEDDDIADTEGAGDVFLDAADEDLDTGVGVFALLCTVRHPCCYVVGY